jgi:hypothetical protein
MLDMIKDEDEDKKKNNNSSSPLTSMNNELDMLKKLQI